MEQGAHIVEQFEGISKAAPAARLAPGKFQTDTGGDRTNVGSWKRRRGRRHTNTPKATNAVDTLLGFAVAGGSFATVVVDGANAKGYTGVEEQGAGLTAVSLSSGMDTDHRYTAAEYNHVGYLSNGWDVVRKWNGLVSSMQSAGIVGPSQTAGSWTGTQGAGSGSGITAGVHVFRYRYMDSTTGYVSNPSVELSVTTTTTPFTFVVENAAGGSVAGEIQLSTDAKVDRIVLEATLAGGSAFYKASDIPNDGTDIGFSLADEELALQLLPWTDSGHEPPPIATSVVSHRDRLWFFGQVTHSVGNASFTNASVDVAEGASSPNWNADTLGDSTASPAKTANVTWLIQKDGDTAAYEIKEYDESASKIVLVEAYAGTTSSDSDYTIFTRSNVIWVCNAGYPEGFTTLNFLTGPAGEMSGNLTAGVGFGPVMVFFSLSSTYKLSWDTDPMTDPVMTPISNKYGALNQRVVLEVEGVVYSMDYLGWQSWAGVLPRHISNDVDDLLDSIDFDQADAFHCVFMPDLRAVRWYVCYSGDTVPKNFVQVDIDTGAWGTGECEVGIQDSRLVPTSEGPKVYLGDENGHVWIADTGTCDGCVSSDSHLTVASGATTTSIPVDETLTTTNVGLAGCMAHWVQGNESKLISSNTSSTLTTAAFSTAPSEGDTVWVGSIPSKLKTRAFTAPRRGGRHVFRSKYCWLMFRPTSSARTLLVRMYDDYSSTAKTWGSESFRRGLPGVTFPGKDANVATSDWKVSTSKSDGVVRVPTGGGFRRTLEVELEIKEPDADVELYQIEIEGEEGERTA